MDSSQPSGSLPPTNSNNNAPQNAPNNNEQAQAAPQPITLIAFQPTNGVNLQPRQHTNITSSKAQYVRMFNIQATSPNGHTINQEQLINLINANIGGYRSIVWNFDEQYGYAILYSEKDAAALKALDSDELRLVNYIEVFGRFDHSTPAGSTFTFCTTKLDPNICGTDVLFFLRKNFETPTAHFFGAKLMANKNAATGQYNYMYIMTDNRDAAEFLIRQNRAFLICENPPIRINFRRAPDRFDAPNTLKCNGGPPHATETDFEEVIVLVIPKELLDHVYQPLEYGQKPANNYVFIHFTSQEGYEYAKLRLVGNQNVILDGHVLTFSDQSGKNKGKGKLPQPPPAGPPPSSHAYPSNPVYPTTVNAHSSGASGQLMTAPNTSTTSTSLHSFNNYHIQLNDRYNNQPNPNNNNNNLTLHTHQNTAPSQYVPQIPGLTHRYNPYQPPLPSTRALPAPDHQMVDAIGDGLRSAPPSPQQNYDNVPQYNAQPNYSVPHPADQAPLNGNQDPLNGNQDQQAPQSPSNELLARLLASVDEMKTQLYAEISQLRAEFQEATTIDLTEVQDQTGMDQDPPAPPPPLKEEAKEEENLSKKPRI